MKKMLTAISTAVLFMSSIAGSVNAIGSNLSVSSNSVGVGQSFTASVSLTGVAAWNIHVQSSGPVSGCSIAASDATEDAMNTSKTFSASCTATGEGTIVISLSGDVTDQNMVNNAVSGTASVVARATSQQTNNTPAQPPTANNQNVNNKSSKINNQQTTKTESESSTDESVLPIEEQQENDEENGEEIKEEVIDDENGTKQEDAEGKSNIWLIIAMALVIVSLIASNILLLIKNRRLSKNNKTKNDNLQIEY